MTTQLIPVFNGSISNETTLLCDARELHSFLSVGKVFAAWIKERIADYGFTENQDFIIFSNSGKNTVGRHRKDYHLTLDTAKELAMVERNDKGRQIRRYFIECEKQLRQKLTPSHPTEIPAQRIPSQTYAMIVYFENGLPVSSRPLMPGEIVMNPESCLEHVMRAGFVTLPCDDVGKFTLDELWLMAEETKKLRDRVRKNYQELAEKYDF